VAEGASQGEHDEGRVAAQAEMFGNRLAKNARNLGRWARREGVSCYRVYDCDIPELPLTVDRYGTDGGVHALVAVWEGARPRADAWVEAMVDAVRRVLEVSADAVHLKVRQRQEGLAQYEKLGGERRRMVVHEGGLRFLVNLDDYLDTGVFLDHRPMRQMVRESSRDKDVLNLFAYTGAFSVHAAAGGARTTTTVDLSQTYLDWARDNFRENGLDGDAHRFVRADLVRWLADAPAKTFDVAVVDPPTFSNSKKMLGTFDVQRDHATLLSQVRRVLRPGGTIWFSTNARRFKPDPAAFEGCPALAEVTEISAKSVPFDFRDRKIHRAWRMVLR